MKAGVMELASTRLEGLTHFQLIRITKMNRPGVTETILAQAGEMINAL